jgi:hypothetical protein
VDGRPAAPVRAVPGRQRDPAAHPKLSAEFFRACAAANAWPDQITSRRREDNHVPRTAWDDGVGGGRERRCGQPRKP